MGAVLGNQLSRSTLIQKYRVIVLVEALSMVPGSLANWENYGIVKFIVGV